jgi:putative permease
MSFLDVIGGWFNRYFSRPDAIFLIAALLVSMVVLYSLAGALAPVLTGLVIAFLLQGLVERLEGLGCPRLLAICVAMIVLIGSVFAIVLLVVPLIWQQAASLLALAPSFVGILRDGLSSLAERFPEFITEEQILGVVNESSKELGNLSAFLLESAFSQVFSLFGLLIYLVLVPISVFFLLKDKEALIGHLLSLLPSERPLLDAVGVEMNAQLGNYVRGKVVEILLVGSVSFITFLFFGLNYAALLGVLVGISVLIPFIGAAIVTFAGFCYRGLAVWLVSRTGLGHAGLRGDPISRRQCACASAVLRGRGSAPNYDHCLGAGLWWFVGALGRLFRHSFGDFDQGNLCGLA